ncbi:probable E3 ubiquitin ligase SUD1 isoform X2 [Phragmites australis]|uniref:probable E3 ubiquitin ligase SUD1 isoform X2 n=1 Tax=Phragmites australis TaxID=29695 RepID=UPI002D79E9F5|nr:probable E3 ubiquitin ligase SUD1 isoform X2 [Phragmites australis]
MAAAPQEPSGEEEEGDVCRICHLPAEADQPLRHPCACRGTIRFVHDDCLLRWLATRSSRNSTSRCEVCKRVISIAPVYAANAPARLPVSEFMLGLANKLLGWLLLLLSLLFSIYVWEFVMPLTTVWVWRLAFSRTFAQVRHLLSLRRSTFSASALYGLRFMPSPDTVLACVSIRRAFLRELDHLRRINGPARIVADALAPLALWVARVEAHMQHRFGGLDTLQVLALHTVEASLMVVIGDVAFAFAFGFLPFSLGRIVLCCISPFSFGSVDIDRSYSSTASILLAGYGFIFSLAVFLAGLHTFQQYSRGERLTVTVFFMDLINWVCWLLSPFRMLPGIHVIVNRTFTFLQQFFRGIICLANISLNLTLILVLCPLFFGWLLDICTSKMFGVTISQKFKLLFASSFASTALHWFIGCIYMKLRSLLSSLLRPVLRLGVSIPFVRFAGGQIKIQFIGEPFYKFYFKMLPDLFLSVICVAMLILVPVEIAFNLVPSVFPLDIIYFDPPTQGKAFWQAPRKYAELLSGVLLLRFLIWNTLKYLEPGALVENVLQYWFATTGQALGLSDLLIAQPDGAGESEIGNSVTPKDQHGRPTEAKVKRRSVAVRMVLLVALAWLTVMIFNSAVLVAPVSVGRALLLAIPQLPIADLFAFAVGFCIISTIIAASRDSYAYVTSGRTRLLASIICNWGITALKSSPLLFTWILIIPFLIGLLVDCLLISPFVVPANEVPVLDFFCTWFLGMQLLKFWTKLVHWTRVVPSLAYFISERWDQKLTRARQDGFSGLRAMWVLQDVLMPITVKLVSALCVPYVLAKGVFPRFGYSAAVNSTVHRFAWLGSLALCALYHLAKVFCRFFVKLHDSIRDERYLIGQRLQNYAGNS